MANTKIGEQGLTNKDIEERNRLIQDLTDAFSKIEESVNSYQKNVDAINGWLDKMRVKFEDYYDDRSNDWKKTKDGASSKYEKFQDEWKDLKDLVLQEGFEDTLEEMRESMEGWLSDLKNLPEHPERRTKPMKIKLFRGRVSKK